MDKTEPEGYTCSECDKYHEFATYVYAHWNEDLHHTCECGTITVVLQGQVIDVNTEFKKTEPKSPNSSAYLWEEDHVSS